MQATLHSQVVESLMAKVVHDSPAWMLYLSWVTTAHIYNVNLTTPPLPIAHNTDGMDIDCSVDVLIENCHYQGSDDAVTMAAGANGLGRKYGRTTENILEVKHRLAYAMLLMKTSLLMEPVPLLV
uniref:Uncharacterized protein n=1 Tax=Acrobeloides nanus TaxID=290746 RepID=A0A914E238_9BILA